MQTLTYTTPHRLAKLNDELVAAFPSWQATPDGAALYMLSSDGATVRIDAPDDADEPAVAAVVAAHDPSTPGPGEELLAAVIANERTIDQRLATQLPVLRDAITAITASPPTLFAGLNNQERVFLRRLARNQADLIRLVLRLLEATD